MTAKTHEIRLKSRPVGLPAAENFELAEATLPEPGAGEVLVRNLWMSVDPYMRGRMYDRPSYVPPFQTWRSAARRRDWPGRGIQQCRLQAWRSG